MKGSENYPTVKMNSHKVISNLDYEVFTYWHAFFLVGAIVTYIVDLTLGKQNLNAI